MFEVLSVREIFFCFVSKFLKIKSGIYKFLLQGDMALQAVYSIDGKKTSPNKNVYKL